MVMLFNIFFLFAWRKWIAFVCDIFIINKLLNTSSLSGGVLVSIPASSMIDHGFESLSGQTEDYEIGICGISAKK